MKLRLGLLFLAPFLVSCGIPYNIPTVGPDGTIALFLDEAGTYDFYPAGKILAFSTGLPEIDKDPTLIFYDLEEEERRPLPQIVENPAPLFWIDSTTLGLVLESEETSESRLLAYDLETGSLTLLIENVE